jgi:hypothetical protein
MTLELWSTFAALGTFVVIAATAIAALVQLRHARAAYQIAALTQLSKADDSPEFAKGWRFVTTVSQTSSKIRSFAIKCSSARPGHPRSPISHQC